MGVRHLGLNDYFKFIFSSDLGFNKPGQNIFVEGASRLILLACIGDLLNKGKLPSAKLSMKAMDIEKAWKYFQETEVDDNDRCCNG